MNPWTKKPVEVAKPMKDRKLQRALMHFFQPENSFEVREALIRAGRGDLIGGCGGLIPPQPPEETVEARRRQANGAARSLSRRGEPRRGRGAGRAAGAPQGGRRRLPAEA